MAPRIHCKLEYIHPDLDWDSVYGPFISRSRSARRWRQSRALATLTGAGVTHVALTRPRDDPFTVLLGAGAVATLADAELALRLALPLTG